jgi:DNA-binding MarR family transcriptional regulator
MSITTSINLRPAEWRTLNRIRNLGHLTPRGAEQQGLDLAGLRVLESRNLVWAHLPRSRDLVVKLADLVDGDSRYIAVRLTDKGDALVDSVGNRVVRELARGAVTVRKLMAATDADEDRLRWLEAQEIIRAVNVEAAFATFHRLPDVLTVELTRKGRQYVAR